MKQILQAHLLLTPRPVAARGPCGILLVPHEELLALQEIAITLLFLFEIGTSPFLAYALLALP
jgi:hypothetical protein